MTIQNPPIFLQSGSHPAEDVRRGLSSAMGNRPGIVALGDLAVTQNGTPNMTVNVAAGQAWIRGSEGVYQGLYFVENRGAITSGITIAASDPTNPRKDLVVLKVQDGAYSGVTNTASIAVVTGVAAASPAEPATPNNCLVLAVVSVAAAATSITNANLTDRRLTPGLYAGNLGGTAAGLGGVIVCQSTTRPSNPTAGLTIYETDTGRQGIYDGAAWQFNGGTGAWTPYTPTWTATTTNPTIGNGILDGAYALVGKTCHFRARVTAGSTTTFGAGIYLLTTPFNGQVTSPPQTFSAMILKNSTGAWSRVSGWLATGTNLIQFPIGDTTTIQWTPTTPVTFANGDVFLVNGTFQTA